MWKSLIFRKNNSSILYLKKNKGKGKFQEQNNSESLALTQDNE